MKHNARTTVRSANVDWVLNNDYKFPEEVIIPIKLCERTSLFRYKYQF